MNSSNKTAKTINSKAGKRPVQGKRLTSQVLKMPTSIFKGENFKMIQRVLSSEKDN